MQKLKNDNLKKTQKLSSRIYFGISFEMLKRVLHDKKTFISGLFICIGFLYFVWILFQNRTILLRSYNPIQAQKEYSQSQWQQSQNFSIDKVLDEWALKNGFTGWKNYQDETKSNQQIEQQKEKIIKGIQNKGVSDSFLYSYAGYKYINGENPSLLNPEHPPLAKYLIGYSIKIFGNEHTIGIVVAFISLLLVGVIVFQIHNSLFAASLALLLTSVFSLFTDQVIHGPQLELYQLFFFLLLVHILLMWMKKKNSLYCVIAGVFFGMLLSTKTLLPFLMLFSFWLIIALWKHWKELFIIFFVGAITFCLSYYSYFVHGGNLRTFLGLQKYIVTYYGNSSIPFLEFLGNDIRLIFTGHWKFWDAARSVSFYSEWNILWPIIFLVGMYKLKIQWAKYKYAHMLIWFVIIYNVFVFIVPIFPRYLLLLFVPLIILI